MERLSIKIFVIIMALFVIVSCDPDPVTPNPDTNPASTETIAQEISNDYSGTDVNFSFDNGVIISLKSSENSSSDKGKVTVKLIKDENYFNAANDVVLDFSDVKSDYTFNLEYTLKPNLVKEDISVIKYTPEKSKEKLNAKLVTFDYDKTSGKISAKLTGLGKSAAGKLPALQDENNSRLVISWIVRENLADGDEEIALKLPYYEQPGGTCWATCAQMLAKAYPKDNEEYANRHGIIDFVKYMEHSTLDEGIGLWDFKTNLTKAINLYSNTKTEVSTFVSSSNMLQKIFENLRAKKPMIMNLTYPGVGKHAIMIVGYKRELISIAKINVKLLIHNPQNVGTESMYKWVDWEWLMKEKWPQEAYQLLYPKDALSNPVLVTMGMPINKQLGDLAFVVESGSKEYKIGLQYDNNEKDNYYWAFPNGDKCDILPDTVSYIQAKLPVYNASKSSKDVEVKYIIKDKKTGKIIEEKNIDATIATGSQIIGGALSLQNLTANTEFEGELTIELREKSSNSYLDGYKFKFRITPSQKLIITLACSVTGKYDNGNIDQAGFGLSGKITFKGAGNKYVGSYEVESTPLSSMKVIQRGNAQIIFDKPVNPTKIISFVATQTMENYYENEKTSDGTISYRLENIPLNTTGNILIKGKEVCNYIKEFNYKAISVDPKYGNIVLKEYYCTDESNLTITIKQ